MSYKTCFFILFLCFFSHACNTPSFALKISISRKKLRSYEIEKKVKLKKFSPNERVTFGQAAGTSAEDLCKKNKSIKGGRSEDCKSSLNKASLHVTKSKGSRWADDVNVRGVNLHSPFFREEDISETDYQPPHRKSPIHNK